MSLVKTLTRGLIYKDGEGPVFNRFSGGGWNKYGDRWIAINLICFRRVYLPYFPIWLLSLARVKWARIFIGNKLGYSSCFHCHMPWKYVKGKTINFSDNRGMFPLCVQCFDALPPGKIDPYIDQLVDDWASGCVKYDIPWQHPQTPDEVKEAAKLTVRKMKGAER